MNKILPESPIFYWMGALINWRYSKSEIASNMINLSLSLLDP